MLSKNANTSQCGYCILQGLYWYKKTHAHVHTERITLKMHVMSVNCTNSPLQNIFPWRNHSTGIGAGGGNTLELRSISLQKYVLTKKKKKSCVCACVCALSCLAQLSSSWSHLHLRATRKPCVCTQSKDCYHCSDEFFSLFITLSWEKREEGREKCWEKKARGERMMKERGKSVTNVSC